MKINVSKGCTLWIYLTSLNYTLNIAKMLYFICVLSKKKIRDNVLWDPFKFSVIPSWNIKLKNLMSCSDRSPGTILLLIRIKKTFCFSRALSRAAEAADHVCVHICVCIHIGAHTYDELLERISDIRGSSTEWKLQIWSEPPNLNWTLSIFTDFDLDDEGTIGGLRLLTVIWNMHLSPGSPRKWTRLWGKPT